MSPIDEIRARIAAVPQSSAGDPLWVADVRTLLAEIERLREALAECEKASPIGSRVEDVVFKALGGKL